MRRFLALGCCAVYLAFGFVAGMAHVHESADPHEGSHGLHLDHAHPGGTADHEPARGQAPASPGDGTARVDSRHVGHHDADALYPSATASRSVDSGSRLTPAAVSVGVTVEPTVSVSVRRHELPDAPRGPPASGPTRPRAPPA